MDFYIEKCLYLDKFIPYQMNQIKKSSTAKRVLNSINSRKFKLPFKEFL